MKAWRSLAASASSMLLALFLAIVVWVVATYERAPPRTDMFPTPIPIRLINLGEDLIIRGAERPETDVRIRALSDAWGRLGISSFEATADLEGLGDGQHEVPVSIETLEEGIDILGVEPSRITVSLEQEVERSIRISVVLLDEKTIPRGYVSQLPVVTPEQIAVRGPRTVVSQVLEAVIELSLNNARDTVTKQEAPALLDANGNQIQGLTISPSTVRVTVPIQRLLGYRDVTVRATTQGTPAPGYWISSIGVEPALVTVYGEQSVIDELQGYLDTQPLDVDGAEQDIISRVPLDLPERVLVLGEGAGSEGILVQISIRPLLGGQTIRRDVLLQGLRFGLEATPSPLALDVILSGPLPALQQLEPNDVQVVINLTTLGRGTHMVTPRVILPDGLGLEVKSIVPDIVEVTIE